MASEGDEEIAAYANHVLFVPSCLRCSTLVVAPPLQLLAYHVKLRGCDVEQPRNLAKSVPVE